MVSYEVCYFEDSSAKFKSFLNFLDALNFASQVFSNSDYDCFFIVFCDSPISLRYNFYNEILDILSF